MSDMLPSIIEQQLPSPVRNKYVIIGHQNFISVLSRAIVGELYKIRRRTMSKVLGTIATVTVILTLIFASSLSPDQSSLQNAFFISIMVINFIGTLLLIVLASTIVGGEYSHGCIRLLLSRGPSRLQFLLAKIGAMLICVFIVVISLLAVGMITWILCNLLTGHRITLSPLTGAQIIHTLLYVLTTALSLFTYCVLAISLSSWGKATAAGITSVLIWRFLEGGIITVFSIIGEKFNNAFGAFLLAIPDYFIGNNLSALSSNQEGFLTGHMHEALSDLHAGLVVLTYLIIFAGITWWTLQTRDITS